MQPFPAKGAEGGETSLGLLRRPASQPAGQPTSQPVNFPQRSTDASVPTGISEWIRVDQATCSVVSTP